MGIATVATGCMRYPMRTIFGLTITICGARTRSGQLCRNAPMANGSGRCRMHGGKSLRGPASPRWRHGRYAKRGNQRGVL